MSANLALFVLGLLVGALLLCVAFAAIHHFAAQWIAQYDRYVTFKRREKDV